MAEDIEALESQDDIALADRLKGAYANITDEMGKLIVGQAETIEQVLLSLFVGGNSIITGVPGLAKTMIIHTVAQVLDLKFARMGDIPAGNNRQRHVGNAASRMGTTAVGAVQGDG